jgi:hypothetical protein
VQLGVFDMVELLIDLIAARLSYSPVPISLLETLAILFDYDSVFHRKHRSKPYERSLYDKTLGERSLVHSPSSTLSAYNRTEPYGWLCQIINRFVSKDGIQHLKERFQSESILSATVCEHVRSSCSLFTCVVYVPHRNTTVCWPRSFNVSITLSKNVTNNCSTNISNKRSTT